MDQFVCVRLVQANRLDLTRFQFDYDLTFAVFFLHADGTILGRYGTRSSQQEADRELSSAGFAAAMEGALALHRRYPDTRGLLQGKQPLPTKYKTPDDYPSLKGKYKPILNYENDTAKSCLHCHQIHDAARSVYRDAGQPIPDRELFIYPLPDVVGLRLDPQTRAKVSAVADDSAAWEAGLRPGDEIVTLDGQALLSMADFQWVLHRTDDQVELPVRVRRGGQSLGLTLKLADGWRRRTDISWRVSSWPLRRMGTGGMVLEPLTEEERRRAGLSDEDLAMRVKGLGRYGPHAAARRAGVRENDILVSFNGHDQALTRSGLLALVVQTTKPGQKVPIELLRAGKRVELMLPMQP